MYDNIIKEIENYENGLKASITTNNTIMKLKNLKLEDVEKEITKARKDENISNEELFSIYEKRDSIMKEIEAEKAKIDFDNVKEEYNMLKERHVDLVKRYKEIERKKEKATNEYIIGELNNDAAYIIQSLENLTIPFSELNSRVNQENKDDRKNAQFKVVEAPKLKQSQKVEIEEREIINNDENQIKEKIQLVQEKLGKQLNVVEEPATNLFNLKKYPKTYDELAEHGGTEPEKNGLFRRVVKSIKNMWTEWNKKTIISEEQLIKKEPSSVEVIPTEVSNVQVSEEQLLGADVPVVNNSENMSINGGIAENRMVPEEQLLNFQSEQAPNVLEQQLVQPVVEQPIPELNNSQEMSFDEIYNPVNMQMNQGKSL